MRIDFHSHILPGIDDGSRSVSESIAMLKMEANQGIDHVVATPHFYASDDSPARFLSRRRDALLRLQEEMEKHTGLPGISLGAEVYYFRGISETDVLPELTFGEQRYMLLEMPAAPWTDRMYGEISRIYSRLGIMPVIAHIDRYISPLRTFGIPRRLREMPVLVQANAGFFLRRSTRSMALKLLRNGQIHLLGSDCHNLENRAPNLGAAFDLIEKNLGMDAVRRIGECGTDILGSGTWCDDLYR